MKAIETEYRGRLFRSRLEARWAVFLDAIGRPWDYERQGYDLPSGRYLPDFWLPIMHRNYPNAGYWLEIKAGPPTAQERRLLEELRDHTKHHCILLAGPPVPGEFEVHKTILSPRRRHSDGSFSADDPHDTATLFRDASAPGESLLGSCFCYVWHATERDYFDPGVSEADVLAALRVASTARFEHGQTPRPSPPEMRFDSPVRLVEYLRDFRFQVGATADGKAVRCGPPDRVSDALRREVLRHQEALLSVFRAVTGA